MAVYQYQQILNMYTNIIPYSRYDVLLYELGRLKLTDITGTTHVLDKNYRSYNTYRKDIGADSLSLKVNETYNEQDIIEETFFDTSTNETNYVFDGIVLSKQFATNGNEMSLEDLFSEFYYNYLTAVDSSYLYNPEYGTTYYFNQSYIDPVTEEEVLGGTYDILPVGTAYMDDDGMQQIVEYDGTYVPTIGELLAGYLYIVIQSEGKPPRKILFNNQSLPTLFINDDKYYTTDQYIMNDAQLMRLCDVKLYAKLGCKIAWKDIAYIDGESFKNMVSNILNVETGTPDLFDEDGNISANTIYFRIYYRAYYKNSVSPDEVIFISGLNEIDMGGQGRLGFGDGLVDHPERENNWVWLDDDTITYQEKIYLKNRDVDFLNRNTGYIPASNVDNHTITLHIQFGLSLILVGYTLSDATYTLQWYQYKPEVQPTHPRPLYWFTKS